MTTYYEIVTRHGRIFSARDFKDAQYVRDTVGGTIRKKEKA